MYHLYQNLTINAVIAVTRNKSCPTYNELSRFVTKISLAYMLGIFKMMRSYAPSLGSGILGGQGRKAAAITPDSFDKARSIIEMSHQLMSGNRIAVTLKTLFSRALKAAWDDERVSATFTQRMFSHDVVVRHHRRHWTVVLDPAMPRLGPATSFPWQWSKAIWSWVSHTHTISF